MTHEQYLAIYERERKKSNSVAEAAYTVFRTLHREITYKLSQGKEKPYQAYNYANTVWQIIAAKHSELKPDGFKNMTQLIAEKNDLHTKPEISQLLDSLRLEEIKQ